MIKITLFLLVIAVVYFFYAKHKADKRFESQLGKVKLEEFKPQYRCVVIHTGINVCKVAQAMANQPILMNEAPVLPLAKCDMEHCDCRYTRHNDRRIQDRRDHLNVAKQIIEDVNKNRRQQRDRRRAQYIYE